MLVKAFKVYVRPILEYNSPVWSPSFVKDILLIESVQRKFTKRIPGMSGLTTTHGLLGYDTIRYDTIR